MAPHDNAPHRGNAPPPPPPPQSSGRGGGYRDQRGWPPHNPHGNPHPHDLAAWHHQQQAWHAWHNEQAWAAYGGYPPPPGPYPPHGWWGKGEHEGYPPPPSPHWGQYPGVPPGQNFEKASREEYQDVSQTEVGEDVDPETSHVQATAEDLEAKSAIEEAMRKFLAGDMLDTGEDDESDEELEATKESANQDEKQDVVVEASGEDAASNAGEGAIYCECCDIWLNGPTQWEDHKIGKKHKKNCKKSGCGEDKIKVASNKTIDYPAEQPGEYAENIVEDVAVEEEQQDEKQDYVDESYDAEEQHWEEPMELEEEPEYQGYDIGKVEEDFADPWGGYIRSTPPPPPPLPSETLTRAEAAQRAMAKVKASKRGGPWANYDNTAIEITDSRVPPPPPLQGAEKPAKGTDAAYRAGSAKMSTWEAKPEPKVKEKSAPIPKAKIKTEAQGYAKELDDLAVGVLKVLQEFPQGLLLSQVKPHLQAKCNVNLSEANFGCSKLQEVFRMPPLDKMFPMEVVPDRNEILIQAPAPEKIPDKLRRRLEGGKGMGKEGKKGAPATVSPAGDQKAKGKDGKGQPKAKSLGKGVGKSKTYSKTKTSEEWTETIQWN